MLIALVIEGAKGTAAMPDVEELATRHNVKITPMMAKSSISVWEDRGFLNISRMLDGSVAVGLKPGRFADALAIVLDYLDADLFEVSWEKEEILTDASAAVEIPAPNGWKLLHVEKTNQPAVTPTVYGHHQHLIPPHDAPKRATIDWTKWGTIFGGAGILVTILIAVIG